MSDQLLQQVLLEARTHNGWLAEPIDDATLHRLYEALRLGLTAANSVPVVLGRRHRRSRAGASLHFEILLEDLGHGQDYGGVRVRNPFWGPRGAGHGDPLEPERSGSRPRLARGKDLEVLELPHTFLHSLLTSCLVLQRSLRRELENV